ncbi:hypothetical protein [Seonamhaeicola marinus]|uniref:Nuclear transport factor 2 family protein n=1 Tax=Seonamhaeicola marinus TaxID=1912246 RepID=A0A5D0HJR2_9FLAO|nr:hypothetical protein [Seonamhaeicola marinus]TYA71623.1 hypothetical protein FUA24_18810 [Seonamhaeicola marinus]
MTPQDIVIKFLNGFNNPEHIQESIDLLTDDYSFKNPFVNLNSKEAFLELAKSISQVITEVNILATNTNGTSVAVIYEFKSALPGVENNIASEWFETENNMIKSSILIYDATNWHKVYANMN